jgi:hypothetical protein
MGFTVENKESNPHYALVKFVFSEPFTSDDMVKVLDILTNLLDFKKSFVFYVDTRNANNPPLNAASSLINWMNIHKHELKKQLICSAVVFGNTKTNNIVSKLLNGVFMIRPPASPNKLSNNLKQTEMWIDDNIKKFLKTLPT